MNKVKETRINQGITQKELAELSNVTERTIINIENNKIPTLKTALQISKALNKSVNYLFQDLHFTEIVFEKE